LVRRGYRARPRPDLDRRAPADPRQLPLENFGDLDGNIQPHSVTVIVGKHADRGINSPFGVTRDCTPESLVSP
jgi:hypothetical protein